jgi:cytoskeleton protein RodZ
MADSEQSTASAAGSPPEPQSLGTTLRQARIARDLSLEQVSTELRIEVQQLEALEQDRFERIGVPVFIKGYVRQYGTFLGLDVRDLLAQYYKQNSLKEIQIQPSKTIKLRDERQITVWIVATLILVGLFIALGVWWWNGGTLPGSTPAPATQTSSEPAAPAAPAVADRAPASAPAPALAATEAVAGATAGAPEPAASSPAATLVAAPAAPQNAAATSPRLEPAPAGASPENATAPFANDGRGFTAELDIVFEQESWAEISDAQGQRLFYDMGAAGRNVKLTGEPPFAVVLGNSAGVKITLDGEDFPVPTSGRAGDYSRFSVDLVEE